MSDYILDVSESAAVLNVDLACLRLETAAGHCARIPPREIAAVVLCHPQITISRAALAALANAGAGVVVCDEKRRPVGMFLPLGGYHAPARRFAAQAAASLPLRKRLWRQIIAAKIRAQGTLLAELHGNDCGLLEMARGVRSGDTTNLEAQAARIYWSALFEEPGFHRDFESPGYNAALNYGYAVLRALVGRALCAAGLHPGLGIHHRHRENPYCLADDVMEPFRPVVDRAVALFGRDHGEPTQLDPPTKRMLAAPMTGTCRYEVDGARRTLMDIVSRVSLSLAAVFEKRSRTLWLPPLGHPIESENCALPEEA